MYNVKTSDLKMTDLSIKSTTGQEKWETMITFLKIDVNYFDPPNLGDYMDLVINSGSTELTNNPVLMKGFITEKSLEMGIDSPDKITIIIVGEVTNMHSNVREDGE